MPCSFFSLRRFLIHDPFAVFVGGYFRQFLTADAFLPVIGFIRFPFVRIPMLMRFLRERLIFPVCTFRTVPVSRSLFALRRFFIHDPFAVFVGSYIRRFPADAANVPVICFILIPFCAAAMYVRLNILGPFRPDPLILVYAVCRNKNTACLRTFYHKSAVFKKLRPRKHRRRLAFH